MRFKHDVGRAAEPLGPPQSGGQINDTEIRIGREKEKSLRDCLKRCVVDSSGMRAINCRDIIMLMTLRLMMMQVKPVSIQ